MEMISGGPGAEPGGPGAPVRYAVLLRGINVGRSRRVSMADLTALCRRLGFPDATSYGQSGNLVLTAELRPLAVAARIEVGLAWELRLSDVDAIVRTGPDLANIIAANPFLPVGADPEALYVIALKDAPGETIEDDGGHVPDQFQIAGREVYLWCPRGYAATKLTNTFFERHLGVRATARNWRTINALADRLATLNAARRAA